MCLELDDQSKRNMNNSLGSMRLSLSPRLKSLGKKILNGKDPGCSCQKRDPKFNWHSFGVCKAYVNKKDIPKQ